jgi:hypothetical protein
MKINEIPGHITGYGLVGATSSRDHAAARVNRGWKPLPQSIALMLIYIDDHIKHEKSFFLDQTGRLLAGSWAEH